MQLCAEIRHRRRQVATGVQLAGVFKAKDYGTQNAYYSGVFNIAPGTSLDVKARRDHTMTLFNTNTGVNCMVAACQPARAACIASPWTVGTAQVVCIIRHDRFGCAT